MAFCTQCGKQIPDQTSFCPYCGSPVKKKTAEPQQMNAQQPADPQFYQSQQPVNVQAYQPQQQVNPQAYQPQQARSQQYQQGGYPPMNYPPVNPQFNGAQPPVNPPQEPKKKSKVPLIILLIVLGLALLGGAIYAGYYYSQHRPEDASSENDDSKEKPGKNSGKNNESEEESQEGSEEEPDSSHEESSEESSETSSESEAQGSAASSESSSEEASSESSEPEPEPEPEAKVVFHIAPIGGITSVDEIHTNPYVSPEWDYFSATYERKGYPQQWVTSDIQYKAGVFKFTVGSGDTLRYGLMDYDGNIVFEPILKAEITPMWYKPNYLGVMNETSDYLGRMYFNADYSTLTAEEVYPFGYEYLPYYYYYEGELYFFDSEKTTGPVELPEIFKGALVPISDKKWTYYGDGNEIGYYYIDSNGNKVEQYGCCVGIFANGYYAAAEDYMGKKLTLIEAKTGEPICDFMYDDVQYFEEGYCAVKRNGKWGFINQYGEEVVSCCFDCVSSVYQGKAAVMLNGKFAVIDLNASLAEGAVLTADVVKAAFENEDTGSAYEAPDPTQTFMVRIAISNLFIRTGPGTDYSHQSYFITPGIYKIVETSAGTGSAAGWGKLDTGEGWVALDYCFIL